MVSPVTLAHFTCGRSGPVALHVHVVEDPPVHRLQAVADVGQGPRHDDRHGVVQEGALHLVLDLDRLDRADSAGAVAAVVAVVGAGAARRGGGVGSVSRTSDVQEPDVAGVGR